MVFVFLRRTLCVYRRKNRTCTDFKPHVHGLRTAVFNIALRRSYVENRCVFLESKITHTYE